MSIQPARLAIQALLELKLEAVWAVTTETSPDVHHRLIEIGHPTSIRVDTVSSWTYSAFLPLSVWISEDDDVDAVAEMYALVTPGTGSIFDLLYTSAALNVKTIEVQEMGRRDVGASGFLSAGVVVQLMFDQEA